MDCSSCSGKRATIQPAPVVLLHADNTLARPRAGFVPPVYRFRDNEETPNTFEDADLNLLLARVVQFRHENSLPEIAYLKDVIVNYTMLSDEQYIPHIEYYIPDHKVTLSAKQYVRSALAFAKATLVMSDEELFVEQQEAERRALSCLNCPRNVQYVNGQDVNTPRLGQSKFCQLSKGRTTSSDGALGLCGVCTCINKCKVHFTKQFIREASTPQLLTQFDQQYVGRNGKIHRCWISDKE